MTTDSIEAEGFYGFSRDDRQDGTVQIAFVADPEFLNGCIPLIEAVVAEHDAEAAVGIGGQRGPAIDIVVTAIGAAAGEAGLAAAIAIGQAAADSVVARLREAMRRKRTGKGDWREPGAYL